MTLLDIALLLVLLGYLMYGLRTGFVVSLGGIVGFALGGAAAFLAVPLVSEWTADSGWRAVAVVASAVLLMAVGSALGTGVGRRLRRGIRWKGAGVVDKILGGLVSLVMAALVMSMIAFTISSLGAPALSRELAESRVIRFIEQNTPEPLKQQAAQVRAFVAGEGIPQLMEGIGALAPVPPPDARTDTPELGAAAASVLRITGTAFQCGQNQTGSGFVIAPGRVVTNAHVVAGVQEPVVELNGGGARTGEVVYFDAVRDLAVIAVEDLAAPVLPLAGNARAGTTTAFAGYPLGGPYQARPATVQGITTVMAPDIYGQNPFPAEVYQLAGNVQQGNSGGPLLTLDGEVTGVIFAKSESSENVGYAITMDELAPVAEAAAGYTEAVSPGSCTRK